MSTSIEGRQRRPRTGDLFNDITGPDVNLIASTERGVLFDGDLTDEQVFAVWWRWTTTDDDDEAALRAIDDLRGTDTTASPLALRLAAYLLGEAL